MPTDPRIAKALRAAQKAVKKAKEFNDDPRLNRSTASRSAYKAKSQALDEVVAILKSK